MRSKTNLIGKKFGRLVVVKSSTRKQYWVCKCSCGIIKTIIRGSLTSANTRSCGCLKKQINSAKHRVHNGTGTPEFSVWLAMRKRCRYKKSKDYKNYGGRGIRVCQRWNTSFANFLFDMGKRPSSNHTIERIDNDKNYKPDNCKWVKRSEQAKNSRRCRWYTAHGKTMILQEWANYLGVNRSTIERRIKKGWKLDRVFS